MNKAHSATTRGQHNSLHWYDKVQCKEFPSPITQLSLLGSREVVA